MENSYCQWRSKGLSLEDNRLRRSIVPVMNIRTGGGTILFVPDVRVSRPFGMRVWIVGHLHTYSPPSGHEKRRLHRSCMLLVWRRHRTKGLQQPAKGLSSVN